MPLDFTEPSVTLDFAEKPAVAAAEAYSANCQATDVPDASEIRFLRFTVPAGKTLYVVAASMRPSGTANLIVEVYNLTDTVQVYGTNVTWVEGALGNVGAGKVVVFRVKNTSGGTVTGCIGFIAFTIE